MDGPYSQPSLVVHPNTETRTSDYPNSNVMGNHKESSSIEEISTNFIDSGETFDRKTTVVDTYFSEQIGNNLNNDPDLKTMAQCRKRPNGINRRKQFNRK